MIGFAFCASHCTFADSISVLKRFVCKYGDICPIMSENAYTTDTRFGKAEDIVCEIEEICGRRIIHTVKDAEPLGPATPLSALVVCPCTGNTLAKCASGITDTAPTMAIKAHLRVGRPTLIALASNDAMSANLANLSTLLNRKSIYFVPLLQDSPIGKPHSLVADFSKVEAAFDAMSRGEQLRPLFLANADRAI